MKIDITQSPLWKSLSGEGESLSSIYQEATSEYAVHDSPATPIYRTSAPAPEIPQTYRVQTPEDPSVRFANEISTNLSQFAKGAGATIPGIQGIGDLFGAIGHGVDTQPVPVVAGIKDIIGQTLQGVARAAFRGSFYIGNPMELPKRYIEPFTSGDPNAIKTDLGHAFEDVMDGLALAGGVGILKSFAEKALVRGVAEASPQLAKAVEGLVGRSAFEETGLAADTEAARHFARFGQETGTRFGILSDDTVKAVVSDLEKQVGGDWSKLSGDQVLGSASKILEEKMIKDPKIREDVAFRTAEYLNLPRALLSSLDASNPLRQSVIQVLAHPRRTAGAWPKMFEAIFKSPAMANQMEAEILAEQATLTKQLGYKVNYYVAKLHDPNIVARQEDFIGADLAERLPLGIGNVVLRSNAGFNVFGNYVRRVTFNEGLKALQLAEKSGRKVNWEEEVKALNFFVDVSTGRGHLGDFERYGPMLSGIFFSPRWFVSRFQSGAAPVIFARAGANETAKLAATDLARFVGAGLFLTGIAAGSGARVEQDPRSSDFGKIRIGNTRFDFWGGFQQDARYITQLITGERKPTTTSEGIQKVTRSDIALNLIRGKLSPQFGFAWDALEGKNVVGEPTFTPESLAKRVIPLSTQDIIDAFNQQNTPQSTLLGIPPVIWAAVSLIGVGVQTFPDKAPKKKK